MILPTYEEAQKRAVSGESYTSLDQFIHNCEPQNDGKTIFRRLLQEALDEVEDNAIYEYKLERRDDHD